MVVLFLGPWLPSYQKSTLVVGVDRTSPAHLLPGNLSYWQWAVLLVAELRAIPPGPGKQEMKMALSQSALWGPSLSPDLMTSGQVGA